MERNNEPIKKLSVRVPLSLYKDAGQKIKIENGSTFQHFFIEKLEEVTAPEVKA